MLEACSARRLVIHGQVQGIGYRYALCIEAARTGVTGWVRNRRDSTVEALLVGEAEAVANLIAWSRLGPPGARVSHIEIAAEEPASASYTDFHQLPTL